MTSSAIGSPMLRTRAPLVLNLPEQAWYDVQLGAQGHPPRPRCRPRVPRSAPRPPAVADGVLSCAELGYAHRDIAALFQVLEQTGPVADGGPVAA